MAKKETIKKYVNKKTKAVITTALTISGGDWELVKTKETQSKQEANESADEE